VKNVEDGKATSDGMLGARTRKADVAKRDRNPKEGAEDFRVRGRPKNGSTLERREA
jgi:hypothetical protein